MNTLMNIHKRRILYLSYI